MENRTGIKSYKQNAQPRRLSVVGSITPVATPSSCSTSHTARNATVSPLTTSASFELGFLPATPLMEEPPFNRNAALYLSVKPGRLIPHAGFPATVVAVECNPTLTRNNHPRQNESTVT